MNQQPLWREVSHKHHCPACGEFYGCAWTPDGLRLRCERSSKPPPGMELVRLFGAGAIFRRTKAGDVQRE